MNDEREHDAARRQIEVASDLVAFRSTWSSLAEVCERLGLDEAVVRQRAREIRDAHEED